MKHTVPLRDIPGPLLTADELCTQLKVGLQTIRSWQAQGIPYVPAGRLRRYVMADVLAWLQKRDAESIARRQAVGHSGYASRLRNRIPDTQEGLSTRGKAD